MAQETILIVDDEQMSREYFQDVLTLWGYAAITAETGDEAIQLACDVQPALILMDIELHGEIDGVMAAAQIRAQADIPIVYLTAHTETEFLQQAKHTGASGYLVKPVHDEELRSMIEIVLYKHKLDREYRMQLEDAVQARTAELKAAHAEIVRAYQALQEAQTQLIQTAKMAAIGELATGITHEFSQSVMVIHAQTQSIQHHLAQGRLETMALPGLLAPIERQTNRIMSVLKHLRAFTRQTPLKYVAVHLNQVIANAFLFIAEHLRVHHIVAETAFASDLPRIRGDAMRLEQVVLSLLTNAREALDAQSASAPGRIRLTTRLSPDDRQFVEMLIADNGGGIAPEHREKIFDPFFTTKEVGQGLGLGLSLSYAIIKDHHGEIRVVETSAAGTTFKVTLPVWTGEC